MSLLPAPSPAIAKTSSSRIGTSLTYALPLRSVSTNCPAAIASRFCAIVLWAFFAEGLLLPPVTRAQATNGNWPPISPEDLALKDNPASRGSHAMILYRESVIDGPHSSETEYSRIKIFDEEGKKYADVEIPYFGKDIQIEDVRARTIHSDGTALDFQGEIYDRVVVKSKKLKYQAKVFTLPGVEAGSIVEYSYRIHWREYLPDQFKNPQDYVITGVSSISAASWIVQEDLFTRRAHFALHPYPKIRLQWTTLGLEENQAPHSKSDGSVELDVENVPAFQEEDFMLPESALRSRVDFFYTLGVYSFSPELFWSQWGKQAYENLEPFLSKHKKVDHLAAQTVAANDSPETKLRKLYDRAQQIRSLGYERFRTQKEEKQEHLSENKNVDDIVDHGYGRGNEINYLFVALARAAGFDAEMVLLTSAETGFFRPSLLDAQQLNAEVVAVRLGSHKLYLDPATHLCPYPLLPWSEADTGGVQLDKGAGTLVSTPLSLSVDAIIESKSSLHLEKDGTLQGQLNVAFKGQDALSRRLEMNNEDTAGRRKELESQIKDWLPEGANVELTSSTGWGNIADPLRMVFNVSFPNLVVTTPHRIMLPLGVLAAGERYDFQHAGRVHPIYFRYPHQEIDELTFELPPGYEVEALPAARNLESRAIRYEISCSRQSNSVVLKRHLVLEGDYFPAKFYPGLRTFFEEVNSTDADRVVLKLAEAVASH